MEFNRDQIAFATFDFNIIMASCGLPETSHSFVLDQVHTVLQFETHPVEAWPREEASRSFFVQYRTNPNDVVYSTFKFVSQPVVGTGH